MDADTYVQEAAALQAELEAAVPLLEWEVKRADKETGPDAFRAIGVVRARGGLVYADAIIFRLDVQDTTFDHIGWIKEVVGQSLAWQLMEGKGKQPD